MINQFSNPEFHDRVVESIAKQISDFSPQLFLDKRHNPKLPPHSLASSVLISVGEKHFLISAAHTFHEEDLQNVGIMFGNNFCPIGGELWWLEPNVGDNYDPNKQDIAIFKLDEITVDVLKKRYKFLTWDKLGFNHHSSTKSRYLSFGFPEKKTRKNYPTKEIIPTSIILGLFGLGERYYRENNFDEKKLLLLLIKQQEMDDLNIEVVKPLPELEGMSGCGVWNVFNLSIENSQFELVSIVTGQNHSKSILYSTKVDVLFNYLQTL